MKRAALTLTLSRRERGKSGGRAEFGSHGHTYLHGKRDELVGEGVGQVSGPWVRLP